jgi:hypothetical protein
MCKYSLTQRRRRRRRRRTPVVAKEGLNSGKALIAFPKALIVHCVDARVCVHVACNVLHSCVLCVCS